MAGYTGDVDASLAWEFLTNDSSSLLVDVRTKAEWAFVGTPDLSGLQKTVIFEEWQQYPMMAVNPDFSSKLHQAVLACGGDTSTALYFLCRSGVRSIAAAINATEFGFSRCYNVTGGFEGPPDANGHRGQIDGWKAKDLPWVQK